MEFRVGERAKWNGEGGTIVRVTAERIAVEMDADGRVVITTWLVLAAHQVEVPRPKRRA